MNFLITGANGFVGTNLSRFLTERGHTCEGLDLPSTANTPAYARMWNWEQLASIPWSTFDATVHLAGKAHDLKNVSNPQSYFDVNVGLTEKVFNAAAACKRFIYFSSSKAADADTPYGKSKLAAEHFLAGRAIVLRPAMIHGPGNKGNLNLLFAFAKHGLPWPLAAFENQRSFTSITNICYAVEALAARGHNGVYSIADDETISTNRLLELIAQALGRKPRLWRIPPVLMKLAARAGDFLRLPLNSERLRKLTENNFVDNSELKRELDWIKMPVHAEDGMYATLRSFVSTHQ